MKSIFQNKEILLRLQKVIKIKIKIYMEGDKKVVEVNIESKKKVMETNMEGQIYCVKKYPREHK